MTDDVESLQYAVDYFADGMFAAEARAEAAEAENARLKEALTVAETLYGGLMADDARALIRAALNP